MGIEPTTSSLGSWRSTAELHPRVLRLPRRCCLQAGGKSTGWVGGTPQVSQRDVANGAGHHPTRTRAMDGEDPARAGRILGGRSRAVFRSRMAARSRPRPEPIQSLVETLESAWVLGLRAVAILSEPLLRRASALALANEARRMRWRCWSWQVQATRHFPVPTHAVRPPHLLRSLDLGREQGRTRDHHERTLRAARRDVQPMRVVEKTRTARRVPGRRTRARVDHDRRLLPLELVDSADAVHAERCECAAKGALLGVVGRDDEHVLCRERPLHTVAI